MQEHLHVGRRTWKRQARGYLLLASIPVFFLIVGFPYMRENADVNGQQIIEYTSLIFTTKKYQPNPRYRPPLFILVPLWNPHHNAAGMQWLADKNPWVSGAGNQ
jgi:hypothetical protein